jgi:hypothetical protein
MVTRVEPSALQRGQTAEVTVSGVHNFAGATSLLFEGSGLSAELLESKGPEPEAATKQRRRRTQTGSVRAKVAVAPDAALGPRELRVVTPQGVSSIGMVLLVSDPVVTESNDKANDEPKGAQVLELPKVVSGTIGRIEDVDWFTFHADASQRLTFSLWGNRLENKIHDLQEHLDPILVLFDARGRELATDDNHDFADPLLSFEFPEAGSYFLQVRDTSYGGNPNWSYVLIATPGPYATSVFPMAVRPGEKAEVSTAGFNLDGFQAALLDVPSWLVEGPSILPVATQRGLTPPVGVVATKLPQVREAGDAPDESVRGQWIALPAALSGRLDEPNDADAYQFAARKGQAFTFEVQARRVGSAADPVLRLTDVKGKPLAEADDTFGKDPRLDWTAPADGLYALHVGDLHSRGGTGFGYVVLAREAKPDFELSCDPDKVNIGPGARTAVFVQVRRRMGFQGAVQITCDGLPRGMSASSLTIPAHMNQGVVVFSAAADAAHGSGLIEIQGEAETPEGKLVRTAQPWEEIYLPGGGRGRYYVATLAAAITDPSDVTIEATPGEIALAPGQTATIDVTIKRREGFDQPVNLALDLMHLGQVFASALPPGVKLREAGSKTLLDPKTTTGKLVLEASSNAQATEKVPIVVMGHVSINFVVKTAYSSAPILVSVKRK